MTDGPGRRPLSWRALDREQRRWLIVNAVLIAAGINAALSALIAWLSAASEDEIPLIAAPFVEGPSTITDSVGTFFVLPFLTTVIITTVIRGEMRKERLRRYASAPSWVDRLPAGRARRGAVLGLACMAVLGPIAVAVLVALDYGDIGVGEFVLYKAIFGVVLGAIVTPPIAIVAMAEGPEAAT
jgi:hypothetical protein